MTSVSICSLEDGVVAQAKTLNGSGAAVNRMTTTAANGNNNPNEEIQAVHVDVEPPDGGYGWIVVLASFLCNLTVDGIAYTFGLFLPELVVSFDSPKSVITWAGSLLSGFYLAAGPVVSALTNKFGCRKVCIAGSLLACTSLCLTTLVSSVGLLFLFYGVLAGTGFSLIYLPAIISVNQYFSQKRATATGIAVCGSGLGAFVFAPLVQYLLEVFGWRGALLILAGLVLNCCVFGALMRPLEVYSLGEKPLMQRIWEEKTGLMRQDSIGQSQFFLVQHPDGSVEKRLKTGINTEPGVHSQLNLDQWGKSFEQAPASALSPIEEQNPSKTANGNGATNHLSNHAIHNIAKRKVLIASHSAAKLTLSSSTVQPTEIRRNSSTPKFILGASRTSIQQHRPPSAMTTSNHYATAMASSNNFNSHETNNLLAPPANTLDGLHPQMRKSIKDLARPMYRKDIFYSGSIRNLPEFRQSSGDVRSYIASVLTIPAENQTKNIGACCTCLPPSMQDTLSDIFDPILMKNPAFVIICVSNLIGMMGFNIPFVFIADMAVTMANVDKEKASLLVSCIGITNMFGRLIFGRLSDLPSVNSLTVNNVTLMLAGVAVAVLPLSLHLGGYTSCMVVCAFFGLMVAAYILLTSIILVELFGLERLTNAFGLLCLVRGLACILGIPFAGVLYDITGSYQCPFIVSGIMLAVSGAISATIPYFSDTEKTLPPSPEDFMSPLEEIPEEESFTEDEISSRHDRRIHNPDDSLAEEGTSLMEEDEDDQPMTFTCGRQNLRVDEPDAADTETETAVTDELLVGSAVTNKAVD